MLLLALYRNKGFQQGHPERQSKDPRERTPCGHAICIAMPVNINIQPTLHTNQRKQPLQVLLFISQREIKSGIHEPRIGNAVPAGDAGGCDTPAKVLLNNEMCHFVP